MFAVDVTRIFNFAHSLSRYAIYQKPTSKSKMAAISMVTHHTKNLEYNADLYWQAANFNWIG